MYPWRKVALHIEIMRFSCWNINGVKQCLHDVEFTDYVKKFDLAALVETHHDSRTNINIKGLQHFDVPAKRLKNKGRGSGGIILYYKKTLRNVISQIKSASKNILWVKFRKEYFLNMSSDIYLAIVYAKPNTFRDDNNIYKSLETEIARFSSKGKVVIQGDLNARTGIIPDYFLENNDINVPLPDTYIVDTADKRCNQDIKSNICGTTLINLCRIAGLRILNGRTVGDYHGSFTCYRPAGKSTVDYIIADASLINDVIFFKVDDITSMSDHCALQIKFKYILRKESHTITITDNLYPKWQKFIINKNATDMYIMSLLDRDIQEEHTRFLTTPYPASAGGTNDAVADLVKVMRMAGERAYHCKMFTIKRKQRHKARSKPWFDQTCKSLKCELTSLARHIKQQPNNKAIHNTYFTKLKQYKKLLKQKQRTFKDNLLVELDTLNTKDPKAFWKLLQKLQNPDNDYSNPSDNIPQSEWLDHFIKLSKTRERHVNPDITDELNNLEQKDTHNNQFNHMNDPVTISEIKTVINRLKNNKSSGPDTICNEMIKHGKQILLPGIAKLFNNILQSKCFPTQWNISAIIPLHKKDSLFNPDNYRGISITSCLGKCFTAVMANRLINCIEHNNLMPETQAAFRKNTRTTDHIYTLQSIINKYCFSKKDKLFCCFVDFKKAFDSVWREALFYKLLKLGIHGNFYLLLKDMYNNTKTCISLGKGLTKAFDVDLGIKQGDCLSPILFNLYVNDIGEIFDTHCNPVSLETFNLNHLMFADDLLLLSETPQGLQNCLYRLEKYSKKWCLDVNIKKTKVVVFQKFGRKPKYKFNLNGENVESVQSYTYLGINFNKSCTFKTAADDLKIKATKASYKLHSSLISQSHVNTKIWLKLFDTLIRPICTYACESWFPSQFTTSIIRDMRNLDRVPCEKLHTAFCKRILGVHKSTANTLARL